MSLATGLNAYDTFPITRFTPSERDGVINFYSSYRPQMTATLDCSSFLMGVTYYYPKGQNQFLHLFEDECHEIFETVDYWFSYSETACLVVDFDQKNWNLIKGADRCPNIQPR
ncbi:MAG: hypothetical protein CME63_04740 [Halobacteriovoraceae bacterium]|nr:hypothetical protein [Halobacteriovoraceae bacterium]MBC97031.1 hypothetical protein [Halobacteriovoraceae bacterium]